MDVNKHSPRKMVKRFFKQFSLSGGAKMLIIVVVIGLIIGFLPVFAYKSENVASEEQYSQDNKVLEELEKKLVMLQNNSLTAAAADPLRPNSQTIKRMRVLVTAYSSTHSQTDDTPFLTASNTLVRDGIVANNYLAFGTKIRMPEIFGNKIFTVTDRMNSRMPNNKFDIWFASTNEALKFGVKNTFVEIIED